jgi:6-phospho-beta-glucosidase
MAEPGGGVKVCVIGGGSTYTPELVEGFARRWPALPVEELALYDIDAERLAVVAGLAGRILHRHGWPGRLVVTGELAPALDGAHFVVCQLRVGGQAARLVDETLPLRYGCIGQETTGPGGFAKALRTVPVVLELAEAMRRSAAPDAWFVNFTNPVGVVTQALLDAGYRAIGLCNVAIGLQRRFAARFGVSPERVALEHVGLNHLSWERAVLVDGVDRLPELLDGDADSLAEHLELPVELLRNVSAVPSYYLRYYYLPDEVLAEQRAQPSRAEQVMSIERELLDLYRDPQLDEKPALLEQRGGAYYSEAAAQLVASLHAGTGDVQVVDVRNGDVLPFLPADAVIECPARITGAGADPVPVRQVGPEFAGLIAQVKAYEQLAARAAVTADRDIALQALVANPLVPSWSVAGRLLDALLAANREHLPRWAAVQGVP